MTPRVRRAPAPWRRRPAWGPLAMLVGALVGYGCLLYLAASALWAVARHLGGLP
jgi:hypothetical protein